MWTVKGCSVLSFSSTLVSPSSAGADESVAAEEADAVAVDGAVDGPAALTITVGSGCGGGPFEVVVSVTEPAPL